MSKKLILTDKNYHGEQLVVPIDRKIEIGMDGEVEVSDECAEILLTIPFWIEAGKEPENGSEVLDDDNPNDLVDDVNSGSQWLEGANLDDLTKLDLDELLEIAIAGRIKNYEKFASSKIGLAKFLKSQLKKLKK